MAPDKPGPSLCSWSHSSAFRFRGKEAWEDLWPRKQVLKGISQAEKHTSESKVVWKRNYRDRDNQKELLHRALANEANEESVSRNDQWAFLGFGFQLPSP